MSLLISWRCAAALLLCAASGLATAAEAAIQDCPECPRVLPLAPGKFMMGQAGNPAQMPRHQVVIGYRFALGETEVTLAQFRHFVQRTGYTGGNSDDGKADARLPATGVDWFAARAYTRWLSRHTGQRYRLPTEAEWEYGARAGTGSRYWWGEASAGACGSEHLPAVFYGLNDPPCTRDGASGLVAVASLRANPWGLYDMLGNADEWMADCPPVGLIGYAGAPSNGAAFNASCTYFNDARVLRSVDERKRADPVGQNAMAGFRVVRELP